jgi:nicotinamide mononucleotide (NMN) deamidase PncC
LVHGQPACIRARQKPDEDGNPAGPVYLCCARRGARPQVRESRFSGDPERVLRAEVLEAFDLIARAADVAHRR